MEEDGERPFSLPSPRPVQRPNSGISSASRPNTRPPSVPPIIATTPRSSLSALILPLLHNPFQLRNICILAHVDHGKTSLTDSLLASNGIISWRLAGKIRFMDQREDEQRRGITMQSSAISLVFDRRQLGQSSNDGTDPDPSQFTQASSRYLINLLDSPGHVDFAGQVLSATRLTDGALLLVDSVEGVCPQTLSVIRMAHQANLKLVLVINKVDRLIEELQMDVLRAAEWIHRLVDQVNTARLAIWRSLRDCRKNTATKPCLADPFDPHKGNVLFASAIDGWAFILDHFKALYVQKYGSRMASECINPGLWGNWNLVKKKNDTGVEQTLVNAPAPHLFANLVLKPIWTIYELTKITALTKKGISNDPGTSGSGDLVKICTSLGITLPTAQSQSQSSLFTRRVVMSSWLPLAECVFEAIVNHLPSPVDTPHPLLQEATFLEHPLPDSTSIILVSKLMDIDDKLIGMARMIKGSISLKTHKLKYYSKFSQDTDGTLASADLTLLELKIASLFLLMGKDLISVDTVYEGNVFGLVTESGLDRLHKTALLFGQLVHPSQDFVGSNDSRKLDQSAQNQGNDSDSHHIAVELDTKLSMDKTPLTVPRSSIDPALLSLLDTTNLIISNTNITPLVRVAIQPAKLTDWHTLRLGLEHLSCADPVAITSIDEQTGEMLLGVAGELHLEQCLTDLKERYAKGVEVIVSEPRVPFRETISGESYCANWNMPEHALGLFDYEDKKSFVQGTWTLEVLVKLSSEQDEYKALTVTCASIIDDLGVFAMPSSWRLQKSSNLIHEVAEQNVRLYDTTKEVALAFSSSSIFVATLKSGLQLAIERGPLAGEPLIHISFYLLAHRKELDDKKNLFDEKGDCSSSIHGWGAHLITVVRDAMYRAMLSYPLRLALSTYSLSIQTTQAHLGKVYSILNRRHAHIIDDEEENDSEEEGSQSDSHQQHQIIDEECLVMMQEAGFYTIRAKLPVVESLGLADEVRSKTSGIAMPQLVFSGYEVLDEDPIPPPPMFTPQVADEEFEEETTSAIVSNRNSIGELTYSKAYRTFLTRAQKYTLELRERKGMLVHRYLVGDAEKQRTLSKK